MLRSLSAVAVLLVGLCATSMRAQTPFGGDDTGFVPPSKSATAKCELRAARAANKLVACIFECHAKRALGKLADDTAEDACESGLAGRSCFALFTKTISKLKGCPTCINGSTMAQLASATEAFLDMNNGKIYCASPSGAFLE